MRENVSLKKRLNDSDKKIRDLGNHSRKLNLLIEGIPENVGEKKEAPLGKIKAVFRILGCKNPEKNLPCKFPQIRVLQEW